MLDLNNPVDARSYVFGWIENDGDDEAYSALKDGTDEDFLRVAIQLFLFVDPRQPIDGLLH